MMKTPVCDFLGEYGTDNLIRFHMPGHKGKDKACINDITEVEGADVLYSAKGIIMESEKNASSLFGTKKTFYSTEGSSLSIRALVYLIKLYALSRGRKPVILALRNAHKTFITACAVMGVDIHWLYSKKGQGVTCCDITKEELCEYLECCAELPTALYITSPDYLGNMADVKGLSALCREKGIITAVDNAHGAYLNFLEESLHPVSSGADICCDSAHKTLPVLTGGAYLHISENAPLLFSEKAEYALSLFASTSPSYLIIESLDRVNEYLFSAFRKDLSDCCRAVAIIKERLVKLGYSFIGDEPLKLTFKAKSYGYRGTELSGYLYKKGIVSEFSDPDYTVLMASPFNTVSELEYLYRVLEELPKKAEIREKPPVILPSQRVVPLNEALYMPTQTVPVRESKGKVCGAVSISCPPAVPVVISGEIIGDREKELLEYYGAGEIEVIGKRE